MADPARARKLADRIRVIVAEMLEQRVKDPRLGFITITEARVTGDLHDATIYYTVYGDDEEKTATAAALESAKGVLRSEVGRQTGVRFTPTLTFVADSVPEDAARIEDLLARANQADAGVHAQATRAQYAGDADPYRKPRDLDDDDDADELAASRARRRRHSPLSRTPGRRGDLPQRRARLTMARGPRERTAPDSLLVVDKPAGLSSHDVVARVRRLVGSRKVGHAGTLDPMATGVLVLGVERATRLLGLLALTDKDYDATVRLGVSTVTDDAEGERLAVVDASGVGADAVRAGVAALTGDLLQRPTAVSAIKVDGVRSYRRVRAGEQVELAARPVSVSSFVVHDIRPADLDGVAVLDVDVSVTCSTGTYVRALARDLGGSLGVGGHLTALRRTRVGPYGLDAARTLEQLAADPTGMALRDAVGAQFPTVAVGAGTAARVRHGAAVPLDEVTGALPASGPVGLLGPDGTLLALAEPRDGLLRHLVVFS